MAKPILPKDFEVPQELETNRFRLRMLKVSDLVKDSDAVRCPHQDGLGVLPGVYILQLTRDGYQASALFTKL